MATTDKKKTTTANNATTQVPMAFTYQDYKQSDAVTQAQNLLQNQINSKPGAYQSQWKSNIDNLMGHIQNRGKFEYNVNNDALYQQYKDQYIRQGQQAMMDTMGQAAALTGGYGNSYAQTVGQQTYQGYLQQLNDRIPELYQLALNQYNQETNDLYNQYGLYSDRENQDYGRYRDMLSDYYAELDRLTEDARYKSDTDYNRYMDSYDMAYGQYRDNVSDWQWQNQFDTSNKQWQAEFDTANKQWQAEFNEDKRRYDQEYQLALEKAYGSGSGTGSGSGSGSSKNTTQTKPTTGKTFSNSNVGKKLLTNGFSGTTYADGVEYLEALGINSSGLLSSAKWNEMYAEYQMTGNGSAEVRNYKSYKDYLRDRVEYLTKDYKKSK